MVSPVRIQTVSEEHGVLHVRSRRIRADSAEECYKLLEDRRKLSGWIGGFNHRGDRIRSEFSLLINGDNSYCERRNFQQEFLHLKFSKRKYTDRTFFHET